jgi:hypothetical protein
MSYLLFDDKLPQEIIDEFMIGDGKQYIETLFQLKYKFDINRRVNCVL